MPLVWQSKAVLLLVLPLTAVGVLLESNWWISQVPMVAWTTLGISVLFGLVVWRLRAGTPRAAATGALITACLMYGTTEFPYQYSWLHGALLPLLSVFLLTFAATKAGKRQKEQFGIAEERHGRNSAQVAANLGIAGLIVLAWPLLNIVLRIGASPLVGYAMALAALAEAAADTVSSEIGQAFGGEPRMLTTLRKVPAGTDGGVTLTGTTAGILAAAFVAGVGSWAVSGGLGSGGLGSRGLGSGGRELMLLALFGGVFGLIFDSALGATLERKGLLNNDMVNLLSTLSAGLFVIVELIAIYETRPHSVLF